MSDLARKIETARERLCEAFSDCIDFERAGYVDQAAGCKARAVKLRDEMVAWKKELDKEPRP